MRTSLCRSHVEALSGRRRTVRRAAWICCDEDHGTAGFGRYQLARLGEATLHSKAVSAPHSLPVISCQSQKDAPMAPERRLTSRKRCVSAGLGEAGLPSSLAML